MDTAAMDMAVVRNARRSSVWLIGFIASINVTNCNVLAAEVEFTPSISSGVIYTDNVDLSATNEQSSEIFTITPNIKSQIKGNNGSLTLDYQFQQLLYSHDSDDNERYHTLSFSADKGISGTGLTLNTSAEIENIARSVSNNANDDVVTGDTIESKSFEAGISFKSNPSGWADLSADITGSITDNEDDIGDYTSFDGTLNFENGTGVKDYFWSVDYDYTTNLATDNSDRTESHELEQRIGLQQINGFSPLMRWYYEEYRGQRERSRDSFYWGPGLRYYWHRDSYLELGYDFSPNDENDNAWRGEVNINPTSRTLIKFEYNHRIYGDAYEFLLKHENRRLSNSISYTEDLSSYNRDNFVEGNRIEEFTLRKVLEWESILQLRRSSATLKLRTNQNETSNVASDNLDSEGYGSTIELTRQISRRTSVTASFDYDYYEFEEQAARDKEEYYRDWSLGVEHEPTENWSLSVDVSRINKSSTENTSEYNENRAELEVKVQL